MTEIEPMVEPYGILDDLRWKSMTFVDWLGGIHDSIIPQGGVNLSVSERGLNRRSSLFTYYVTAIHAAY
jgi:hypothetical protein